MMTAARKLLAAPVAESGLGGGFAVEQWYEFTSTSRTTHTALTWGVEMNTPTNGNLILILWSRSENVLPSATGYDVVGAETAANDDRCAAMLMKVANNESGDVIITVGGGGVGTPAIGVVVELSGAANTTTPNVTASSLTTLTVPSMTTTADGCLAVFLGTDRSTESTETAAPSAYTSGLGEIESPRTFTSQYVTMFLAHGVIGSAGATDALSFSSDGTGDRIAFAAALEPA